MLNTKSTKKTVKRKSICSIIPGFLNVSPHLLSCTVLHGNLYFQSLWKLSRYYCERLASLVSYKGHFDSLIEVTMHNDEDCLLDKSENSEWQWRLNFYAVFYSKQWKSWSDSLSKKAEQKCVPSHMYTLIFTVLKARAFPCPTSLLQAEHSLPTVSNNKWIRVTLCDFWGWVIKGRMTSPSCSPFQTEHCASRTSVVFIFVYWGRLCFLWYTASFMRRKVGVLVGINADYLF